jgi:hypothetical protein
MGTMLQANETEMVFGRKVDALRVKSALDQCGIKSRYVREGRGSNWLRIAIPEDSDAQRTWGLARTLYFDCAKGRR